MKWKLESLFRVFVILLLGILLWSVWQSEAQTNEAATNVMAGPGAAVEGGTNVPPAKEIPTLGWFQQKTERYPFLQQEYLGNPLWKYLFSLIYIFLAFYISKFLDYATRVWLKRVAERTQTKFDDMLLELLNGPVKIVAFVIFLRIGLEVFDWPEVVDMVLTKGFAIVVAATLTYMVLKVLDLFMTYWRKHVADEQDKAFNDQLFPIIRKTLKAFVIVVATLVTLSNIGVNITAAIASLSIGGLALGLAAQDTVANLFGAVSILLDKPFRIGDRIRLPDVDGTVESIGLRSTRIRNLDGHLITVPNKTMGNATITNITRRPNIKTVMNIGITYDTPRPKVERALALLNEIYKAHPMTADVWIAFDKFADCSLNILVIHWWNSTVYKDYLGGMQELNLAIKERFDAEGISFAFPTRTLYVKQDSDWKLGSKSA
ncbi:MAG: mechanosensitive ion channel family protein [Limisphaerales bacterium]